MNIRSIIVVLPLFGFAFVTGSEGPSLFLRYAGVRGTVQIDNIGSQPMQMHLSDEFRNITHDSARTVELKADTGGSHFTHFPVGSEFTCGSGSPTLLLNPIEIEVLKTFPPHLRLEGQGELALYLAVACNKNNIPQIRGYDFAILPLRHGAESVEFASMHYTDNHIDYKEFSDDLEAAIQNMRS